MALRTRCNGGRQGFPGVLLGRELLVSALGQLEVLGAAIVVGGAPARFDPAAALEPMKGSIERSMLDTEDLAGDTLDVLRDGPALLRAQGNLAEDERVERALRKTDTRNRHCPPLFLLQEICTAIPVEVQGVPSYRDPVSRELGVS